jgi:hypothetical protein
MSSKFAYEGELGPLADEINIKNYLEKHPNTPLMNGAFKSVLL